MTPTRSDLSIRASQEVAVTHFGAIADTIGGKINIINRKRRFDRGDSITIDWDRNAADVGGAAVRICDPS